MTGGDLNTSARRAIRIWPAIVLLVVQWALRPLLIYPDAPDSVLMAWFFVPPGVALLVLIWWAFFSRATGRERGFGSLALIALSVASVALAHPSVQTAGAMLFIWPWGMTGFAAAIILLSRSESSRRVWYALLAALLCFGYWDLVRMDAFYGNMESERSWRWTPSAEEQLLSESGTPAMDEAAEMSAGELGAVTWPGFRGAQRDGAARGVALAEDWRAHPPKELWRIPVGPGWSSFAVAGDRLFTQEQRGDEEVVVCYNAASGAEIWVHRTPARFFEAIGGAGPRATPTIADGRLYSLGAMGHLSRIDPLTGATDWEHDIREDAGREPPSWGFSSSPLVTHGLVIVHAGGEGDRGLLAYDLETAALRWSAPAGDHSYSSAQLATLDGQASVLLVSNRGIDFVDPSNGTPQGLHDWPYSGYRALQPAVLPDGSVVTSGGGTRRVSASWGGEGFSTEETWTSRRLNPDFHDSVAHEGFLYGFDRSMLACIDLATGERKWRKGRYGNGQLLLLPDADQLLVLSEKGEIVLLRANPEAHTELARHSVLSGRTWNHPVLVGDRLYVRNAQEAACFQVPLSATTD